MFEMMTTEQLRIKLAARRVDLENQIADIDNLLLQLQTNPQFAEIQSKILTIGL